MKSNVAETWEQYREKELRTIKPLLQETGFVLDPVQVHTGGERFLTKVRDVGGGGLKLVLTGRRLKDNARVIIKASSDPQGIKEIERERAAREMVTRIEFALRTFRTPEELLYLRQGTLVISVTAYIAQELPFFEHTLDEQFFLALRAFETQEGVHATTHSHAAAIRDAFGMVTALEYLARFAQFEREALTALPNRSVLAQLFTCARSLLTEHRTLIERYCGFLTHADFVPNNFRVIDRDIYLLDYSSIHFGNKYESWARFLNFMIHHNPELERTLSEYVRSNRGEEEYLSLRLMRIYKIGFLLAYYAQVLENTTGNLRTLTEWRLKLWSEAMRAMLDDRPVSREIIASYVSDLHRLRSPEERERQREMLGRKQVEV